MSCDTGNFRVLNKLDRVRPTSVFRDARVGIIDIAVLIEDDILEHSTKSQSLENIRLALGRKINRLCVAAAFDVEDPVIAPNVFVVANEMTLRISRECGFSRAAETEEQGRHSRLFICRGRAMHREQTTFRRKIIGNGKNAFFHLAGIFGTQDNKFLVLEAEIDAGRRAHAGRQSIRRKRACVVDDEVWCPKAGEFLTRRTDEHGVHEERVIRPRADDAYLDAIFRIPACEAVETVEPLARVEIVKRPLAVDLECAFVARNVYWSPPHVVFGRGMLDHTLVLW